MPTEIDKAILEGVNLERFKSSNIIVIMLILNKLNRNIQNVLLRMDKDSALNVNKSLRRINSLVDKAFKKIEKILLKEYKDLIKHAIDQEEQSISVEKKEEATAKEKEKASESILASLVLGTKLTKHLSELSRTTKARVSSSVRTGISDNESTAVISQRVRGTRSRKFRDGSFNTTLTNMDAIIRTAVQTYVNRGKQFVWKRVGIQKYVWLSTLDSNTTSICWDRSNEVYSVGSGPLPPAHYRCRSTVVAFTKGMQLPKSFGAWLRTQPRGVVEDVLGKAKAGMFLSGKMSINKFTTPRGRELTLEELRKRS